LGAALARLVVGCTGREKELEQSVPSQQQFPRKFRPWADVGALRLCRSGKCRNTGIR
jgi:hypothetical protein